MIANRKLHYLPVFISLCLALLMNTIIQAQITGKSFEANRAIYNRDPSVINDYKYVIIDGSHLDMTYTTKTIKPAVDNELLFNSTSKKLTSFGIPIIKYKSAAKDKCDMLVCYLGPPIIDYKHGIFSDFAIVASIYFVNCHDEVILSIPAPPHGRTLLNEQESAQFKVSPETYINSYVERMFSAFGSYHYNYNAPVQAEKSNPVTTKSAPVQINTGSINQTSVEQPKTITIAPLVSDVDLNIPVGAKPNSNRFALIIGNEDYHSSQNGLRVEANVEFAAHDAATFKEYAIKVLGVPEENLLFITNAKLLDMNRSIDQLSLLSKATAGEGEIFFYYAGHGYPDEKTKEAYIIPVDVSGSDLKYALKLKDIYTSLTAYQSKRVTIFLDACFSGGAREEPLLANRGIKIKPKETTLSGNEVVFCATSSDQSAMAYKAKGHGMFTYFLLKKLQETKGDVAYSELYESLQKQVAVKSILENRQEQSPTMVTAPGLGESWKGWRMK